MIRVLALPAHALDLRSGQVAPGGTFITLSLTVTQGTPQ